MKVPLAMLSNKEAGMPVVCTSLTWELNSQTRLHREA